MSEMVDLHIGKRLRRRRKLLGLTQTQLGALCGVRFQQIQKYESAQNHISAAMLWRVASGLGVDVQYFYEGLESVAAPGAPRSPSDVERRSFLLADQEFGAA
ncbi:MAG: helix-turn-helix domain-containing protein [Phenylobacterium sp.]